MLKTLKNYPVLTICLFVAVMLLPNLDTLQVSIMEARNFISAREMVLNDHWLLTTMNGEPRYQKPPLPTWLSAVSAIIFGVKSVFAMRLPAILMVMAMASYMFFLSRSVLKGSAQSLINALILTTSLYVTLITIEAPWDIFTHGFMLIAIYHLYRLLQAKTVPWKNTILAGVFLGLSLLSKGPIAVYALLLPFLIAYGFAIKYKQMKQKIMPFISIVLIALVVGGWWFLYVRLADPVAFEAITNDEAGKWGSYNTRPIYYYWSFFVQSGIWTIPAFISLLYPYMKGRVNNFKAYKFSFLWTIIAVILLSLVPTKKSRYLMPVLIPLAFNIGFYIDYLFRKFKNMKDSRETLPVYFNFGLIGTIALAAPLAIFYIFKSELQAYWVSFLLFSIVVITIGLAILFQLYRKRIKNVFLLTILFFASLYIFGLPLSKAFRSEEFTSIAQLKKENDLRGLKLYALNYVAPESIWQYGGMLPQINRNDAGYIFPLENKFGILFNAMSPTEKEMITSKYNIRDMGVYNLNQAPKSSKQYNERLLNSFYILTKK
ncbi:glycosyltransferase family 39 protein [Lacinutrix sp. Hel_I_90]|uniref:ArnT family glycosyltransferase n=1 Tax=Lacinutrix sp. Hel_I_90 TaxID=1249999 RepID=UPI0005CA0846|nr:glycosyltransferase family 39 protein [Lacinutrix sp. Hel_I_90]